MPFWLFLAVINLFQRIFKNIDQNNICASIVFKAKTKDKYEETFFKGFLFHSKMHFLGGQPILFWIFFLSAFASKTIDSQLLFWLICFKMHFIKVNNCPKLPKWCFWQLIAFFHAFSKIPTKRTFVLLLFLKLNQSWNTKKTFF